MIISLLKFVHATFGLIGIFTGSAVLFRLLAGIFLEKWAVIFLKCALAVGVTALLLPAKSLLPTHQIAMIEIYVSGIAVYAHRRFHFVGIWSLVYVLSLAAILCLQVLVVVEHIFHYIPLLKSRFPMRSDPAFLITESVIILFFGGFGMFAIRRYCCNLAQAPKLHTERK